MVRPISDPLGPGTGVRDNKELDQRASAGRPCGLWAPRPDLPIVLGVLVGMRRRPCGGTSRHDRASSLVIRVEGMELAAEAKMPELCAALALAVDCQARTPVDRQ